jgi:type II secretory pathway pseudopilin PulG
MKNFTAKLAAEKGRIGTAETGMTLMEGLAALGIMTIILVLVAEIFGVNMNLVTTQLRRTDTATGAIQAIRRLSDEARGASAVEESHVFGGDTYTTSADALVLNIPSIDANGDIIAGEYDHVAFYRDGSDPTKVFSATDPGVGSQRPAGARLLSGYNDIMAFRFNNPDPTEADRVSVYIENSRTYRGQPIETKAWTSIFLRNR